jgi:hypothetical protein
MISKLISESDNTRVFALPKTIISPELRKFMVTYNAVIAGSFATHWAQVSLNLENPVKWNNINVVVDVTKQNVLNNLKNNLSGKITSVDYIGVNQTIIHDACANAFCEQIIYTTVADSGDSDRDASGNAVSGSDMNDNAVNSDADSPTFVQYLLCEKEDPSIEDDGDDYDFAKTVSDMAEFTVTSSTITVTANDELILTVANVKDLQDRILRVQKSRNEKSAPVRAKLLNKWRSRGFIGDVLKSLICENDSSNDSKTYVAIKNDTVYLAHDHCTHYTFLGCSNINIIVDDSSMTQRCKSLHIDQCSGVVVTGGCPRIWVHSSEVHFESLPNDIRVVSEVARQVNWLPKVNNPCITGLRECSNTDTDARIYFKNATCYRSISPAE